MLRAVICGQRDDKLCLQRGTYARVVMHGGQARFFIHIGKIAVVNRGFQNDLVFIRSKLKKMAIDRLTLKNPAVHHRISRFDIMRVERTDMWIGCHFDAQFHTMFSGQVQHHPCFPDRTRICIYEINSMRLNVLDVCLQFFKYLLFIQITPKGSCIEGGPNHRPVRIALFQAVVCSTLIT